MLFFFLGCGPAKKSFHIPELNSSAYPNYESEIFDIDEPVVLKTRPASGSYKSTAEISGTGKIFKHSIGSNHYLVTGKTDWKWDVSYSNSVVHINNALSATADIQDESLSGNITCQSKLNKDGDVLEHGCSSDLDKYGFEKEEEQEIIDQWAYGITIQLILNSKPLTIGDVFRYHHLENIQKGSLDIGVPEIVKGITVYKGRKSILTEYLIDDVYYEEGLKFDIKYKGYSLYDIDSSILLSRKESYYIITSIPGSRAYDTLMYGNISIDIDEFNVR